jgi:CelD/BcsL family acetyltransferase involved in cellulose biosynthesis
VTIHWTQSASFAGHETARRECRFVEFDSSGAISRAWQRLERDATLPTQSLAFSAALSRSMLADALLKTLLVSGAGGALLPLCRKRGYFARWRTMGSREVFEPIDLLGSSPAAVSSIAECIARQPRPFQLDRIPADSALVPALQQAMRHRGWLSQRPAPPCPTIALSLDWTQPESRFNPRRRSDFRRAARRAAEFGAVTYEMLAPQPEEFDALFDEAIGVEMCSWKQAAGTAIAADQAKETFFREFFRSACAQGNFRIAFLRIDGCAVAMQMALEWRNRYWLFKIGYDEKFGKCSPGTLLMLHALGWAAGRKLRSFELLGNVEPWITELWTKDSTACLRLRTYPFGIRGAAAFGLDALAWACGRVTRRLA